MTNIIETHDLAPATISANSAILNAPMLAQLSSFAKLMSESRISIPEHLVGNHADCMAVLMQAIRWGMDPYAVAQKTHLVNGKLGYEAQLVNAVISSSTAINGRFHYKYGGDWSRCTITREIEVRRKGKHGEYTARERVRGWTDAEEMGLFVCVGAVIQGETEITWGEPLYLSSVVIRNSPLWVSNPKQQIAYLGLKYWARLYTPDVILGVYTKEELEGYQEKEINPRPASERVNLLDMDTNKTVDADEENFVSCGQDSWVTDFRKRTEEAETKADVEILQSELEQQKQVIGIDLYIELKNKAISRKQHLYQVARISKMINELPKPGQPEAAEKFVAVENALNAVKVHLGELYDGYSVTLADMKPEYIGA